LVVPSRKHRVVALPLALAFGISSGVGAAAGLITAVIAGLVAAVFGGSHVQVSGPTGAMAVVLAPIVAHYGLGSVAMVTVLAGLIVVAAGVTGLGRAVTAEQRLDHLLGDRERHRRRRAGDRQASLGERGEQLLVADPDPLRQFVNSGFGGQSR